MKKLSKTFIALLAVLCPVGASGQGMVYSTTDKFVVSDLQTQSSPYFIVGLQSNEDRYYCAFNMTLDLPIGVTFAYKNGNARIVKDNTDMYPYDYDEDTEEKTYKHSFSYAVQTNPRQAKIACFSPTNTNLSKTSGNLFKVYVEYNAWTKAGENTVSLTGLNMTTNVGDKYISEGDLNTGTITIPAEGREVEISISKAAKFGTCILPFNKSDLPDGVTAYKAAGIADGVLTLQNVESMQAYQPYILYAPDGFSATWSGVADAEAFPDAAMVEDNGLCGVIEQTSVESGYILQLHDGDEEAQFYRIGDTPFSLKAGRCFLSIPSASATKLSVRFDDATGIETVNPSLSCGNGTYNLAGQKVLSPTGGVYIRNGKKIVITNNNVKL